jgi:hypothetical protein
MAPLESDCSRAEPLSLGGCVVQAPYSKRERELIHRDPQLAERFAHLNQLQQQVRAWWEGRELRCGGWVGTAPYVRVHVNVTHTSLSYTMNPPFRAMHIPHRAPVLPRWLTWRETVQPTTHEHERRPSSRRWTRCSTRCDACTRGCGRWLADGVSSSVDGEQQSVANP